MKLAAILCVFVATAAAAPEQPEVPPLLIGTAPPTVKPFLIVDPKPTLIVDPKPTLIVDPTPPAPVEPVIAPTDPPLLIGTAPPTVKPFLIVNPKPTLIVDPKPSTPEEHVIDTHPTPILIGTPPPTVRPTFKVDLRTPAPIYVIDPIAPELDCPKERVAFADSGLPVEPRFEEDSCRFVPKQCNDKKCFCVDSKNGKRKYGKLQVPIGHKYDCSKKAKKCHQKQFSTLIKEAETGKPSKYVPSCTQGGQYDKKQCDKSGVCWCIKKNGKEIKFTRNSDGDSVTC